MVEPQRRLFREVRSVAVRHGSKRAGCERGVRRGGSFPPPLRYEETLDALMTMGNQVE
jgi:hypothetical protein